MPHLRQSLRWAVWQRDGFACVECGSSQFLTVDHIIPVGDPGGGDHMSNLRTLCRRCNSLKGGPSRPIRRGWDLAQAPRFAALMERARMAGTRAHQASGELSDALLSRDRFIAQAWAARPQGLGWKDMVRLYAEGVPPGARLKVGAFRLAERSHRVAPGVDTDAAAVGAEESA